MRLLMAFITGAIFSMGLLLSGMTDTHKVIGFLDITGDWDPTLIFVMGGALLPMFIAWKIAAYRKVSVCGDTISLKASNTIDRPLLVGPILFGMGWGLAGFCPGPALASLSFGGYSVLIFVAAMVGAMALYGMFVNK